MINSKYQVKNAIVNKHKLIYMPFFIGFIIILAISTTSYLTSKRLLLDQMKQNGISLAKQTALQVEGNAVSLEVINRMIEEKIRVAQKAVRMNEKNLSNDLLKKSAVDLGVQEIYWYSSEGEILYSNIDAYLGWKTSKDHPVENFRISGKDELIEGIRKDSESNNYNKYGYLRNIDGSFIQIGIRANEVRSLTGKFNYQTLVEKLAQGDNIIHVLFIDKNFNNIADSNIKDVGIIYDKDKEYEMGQALKGNISTKDLYCRKTSLKEMEIYVPVTQNGQVTNVLVLSLSTEEVYNSINRLAVKSSVIAIIMLLMLLWISCRNKNL